MSEVILVVTYMDTTLLEHITLPCILIEHCIESETLRSTLQTQKHVLVVWASDNVLISSAVFMRHHGSHSHRHSDSLSSTSTHHHVLVLAHATSVAIE